MRVRERPCALWPIVLAVTLPCFAASAQQTAGSVSSEEAAYRRVIQQRADKIVAALDLPDEEQRGRVARLIADQYRALRDIHDARDRKIEQAGAPGDPGVAGAFAKAVRDRADRQVVELHRAFVGRLAAELPAEKVDGVKDGMTYGVAPLTYAAYLRLLPDLKEEQKRFIRANLYEAREYAMDAGSSEEKHAWFGKYKGRINNYLSAAGYDLKQAERDLRDRAKRERAGRD